MAAVIFGGAGNWALGAIAMQHWGEKDFELANVRLLALYNFESAPGVYLGYDNGITYNWNGTSGKKLTVPLGVTLGRTMLLSSGNGLDLNVGAAHVDRLEHIHENSQNSEYLEAARHGRLCKPGNRSAKQVRHSSSRDIA